MAHSISGPGPQRLTLTYWLILAMAAIGFAFDIYQLLMGQLILPPALAELMPDVRPGTEQFNLWRGLLFWIPAMAGGIFGLWGGYLTDRLGRRRVLTGSILIYSISAFAAGYSTSMTMLLILRSTTFIGVCVEFVAAVAWLAELFPDPHQRERALGYTQAFSSIGGLSVGGANLLCINWSKTLPAIAMPEFLQGWLGTIENGHAPWRYLLISGLIPAIPLLLIRPFLPESPAWRQKKAAGTLKRPSLAELFSPALLRTTVVTTIMFACSYGAAFGAIQQMPSIAPGLPEVREQTEGKPKPEAKLIEQKAAANYQVVQEVGGLVGRFLLALLVIRIVSRRKLLRVFLIPGLIVVPSVFAMAARGNPFLLTIDWGSMGIPAWGVWHVTLLHVGIFLAGLFTVAQFSFWGNYLPGAYPLHLRGTGESMAANIGGRMLGTSFAAVTSLVSGLSFIPGSTDPVRIAWTASGIALFVYLVGTIASFFLPEPRADMPAD